MNASRWLVLAVIISFAVCTIVRSSANQTTTLSSREDAYRANNIGVALLDQFKYREGADAFRQALKADPQLSLARLNLGIALYNLPELDAALRETRATAAALPASPHVHYMLALIARAQNRVPDALAEFQSVLQIDPRDPGANINIGQLLNQQRKYSEAIPFLRAAVASDPYNITAAYQLGIALNRSGAREESAQLMERFKNLRESGAGTTIGQNYQEQGRYANAVSSTGAEKDVVDAATPDVKFNDATAQSLPAHDKTQNATERAFGRQIKAADWNEQTKQSLLAGLERGMALFDFDLDGDLDLFDSGRLYRNSGGKFTDVTEQSGLSPALSGVTITGAVAGDYDNDGIPDLFVLGYPRSVLYHNDGNGKFSDVTRTAGVPAYPYLALSCALVDVDHDGDLDIFVVGCADLSKPAAGKSSFTFPDDFAAAPNLLLRNDGNGKFTDTTSQAKVAGKGAHGIAVVPTDFDNHRDIDLLVVHCDDAPSLFSNQRDGTFNDVAAGAGLGAKGRFTCVAAGDVNKDDFTDFFFGTVDGAGVLAMSDGKGRFVISQAPPGCERASAAQFVDYDNDGLLDLVVFTDSGARALRNIGEGRWQNVSEGAFAADLFKDAPARRFLAADIDGDGDTDLVARFGTGDLKIVRNDGGNRKRSLDVQLIGKVSNRSGTGSKVEARSGSLKSRFETYAATPAPAPSDIVFGIGKRTAVDAVRVLWPAGILQAETEIPKTGPLKITEVDRKPSSCPFLYAWNGEHFEFITDFMGGGEMGYWESPGVRNHPDPDEYVRIRGDQLKERNGRLELRMTNELEEVLYVDHLKLIAVAHPADTEVYPNEGMTDPPRPFKLWVTRSARPPAAAHDGRGNDVLDRLSRMDRRYPDDFELYRIRGYAAEHTLTLDLGQASTSRTLLLLTGWTDYAFSSDNVAAQQSGLSMKSPAVQVKDRAGEWKTVIEDIGIPVGRPQTIVLDLTGKFLSKSREVRIVTNMRIYWDQILVDTSNDNERARLTALAPLTADLHWRGFSAEVKPGGHEPIGYDYDRVTSVSPWKVMPGRYTREGDVRALLKRSDDIFVISQPGDEISLSFDATKLPRLRKGWKRTFLLYADGFSKEMDINSASPDAVMPLPFHGMKDYPSGADERRAMTRQRRAYLDHYNTRIVSGALPAIDTALIDRGRGGGTK